MLYDFFEGNLTVEYCSLKALKKIAEGIAEQFGSNCEVLIHDVAPNAMDSKIVYIKNGYVSNRKLGDGPSQIVLEASHKDVKKIKDSYGYLTKTKTGKMLKSSTLFFSDTTGKKLKYILSINFDITNFAAANSAIQTMLLPATKKKERVVSIPNSVNDLLDNLIEKSIAFIGKPAPIMTRDEKRKAIRYLNEAGTFLITRSGDKVAKYFGISKYTLYSYIGMEKEE